MALEALKDLFVTNLLPDARRLVPFESRPLLQALAAVEEEGDGGADQGAPQGGGKKGASGPGGVGGQGVHGPGGKAAGKALLMWYFEDQV